MWRKIHCLLVGLLVSGFLVHPAFAVPLFPDVDEYSEYAEAIAYVSEAGIMVGDDKGNFNPDKLVTRAEMAAIICRMLSETENLPKSSDFSDVPISYWANAYISKAAEFGIVNGYGEGKFGPSDGVTYEQGVTMIVRALGGEELASSIGGYPNGFLTVAEQHGFLENTNTQKGDPLSRGDVAIFLFNCAGFSFLE